MAQYIDKVQKIREEVERLKLCTMDEHMKFYSEAAEAEYNALCNIEHFIDSLQEEPVSECLEKAAEQDVCEVVNTCSATGIPNDHIPLWVQDAMINEFIHGAKWQKENLLKPADGDDLPEINREVIALFDNGKVGFAHRPPEYWDGKDIVTGKVTRHYPKTYGKGGWNIPNVKYWLDCSMPKEIEL